MKAESIAGFAANLRAELETFREFLRILQQEQTALIDGNIDQLLLLAPDKTALIDKLTAFSADRDRQMASAGYENTPAGLAAWFDAIGIGSETRNLWKQLLDLASEAEQANRANGILIETHLRHNQQAMSVLQSAANPGNSLYGPNGQISGITRGRPIGKV